MSDSYDKCHNYTCNREASHRVTKHEVKAGGGDLTWDCCLDHAAGVSGVRCGAPRAG